MWLGFKLTRNCTSSFTLACLENLDIIVSKSLHIFLFTKISYFLYIRKLETSITQGQYCLLITFCQHTITFLLVRYIPIFHVYFWNKWVVLLIAMTDNRRNFGWLHRRNLLSDFSSLHILMNPTTPVAN